MPWQPVPLQPPAPRPAGYGQHQSGAGPGGRGGRGAPGPMMNMMMGPRPGMMVPPSVMMAQGGRGVWPSASSLGAHAPPPSSFAATSSTTGSHYGRGGGGGRGRGRGRGADFGGGGRGRGGGAGVGQTSWVRGGHKRPSRSDGDGGGDGDPGSQRSAFNPFFKPSFLENPWARLERSLHLAPGPLPVLRQPSPPAVPGGGRTLAQSANLKGSKNAAAGGAGGLAGPSQDLSSAGPSSMDGSKPQHSHGGASDLTGGQRAPEPTAAAGSASSPTLSAAAAPLTAAKPDSKTAQPAPPTRPRSKLSLPAPKNG